MSAHSERVAEVAALKQAAVRLLGDLDAIMLYAGAVKADVKRVMGTEPTPGPAWDTLCHIQVLVQELLPPCEARVTDMLESIESYGGRL